MKKTFSFICSLIFVSFFYVSCPIYPFLDYSQIPSDMMTTFDINYEEGLGTATFTSRGIDVNRGSSSDFGFDTADYLKYYNNAYEFDSDNILDQGYSISTTYEEPEFEHPIFTLICTKKNSATIKYIFYIFSTDIRVFKSINDVLVGDNIDVAGNYKTYLTWR